MHPLMRQRGIKVCKMWMTVLLGTGWNRHLNLMIPSGQETLNT